jgi:imidazolonepropionase-like amidohydrolase
MDNTRSEARGYTDRHIHLFMKGRPITVSGIDRFAKILLEFNIKEVYDMGSRDGLGFQVRRYLESTPITLKTCIYALYREGGYGSFLGRPVKDRGDIKRHVNELYKRGADFVKVINSGIISTEGRVTEGGFSEEELRIIVEEAHEKGLQVFCHVSSAERIIEALNAGVDSVEHGFFMTEEALHMMKERGISWTPTIYALTCFANTLSGRNREVLEGIVKDHMKMVSLSMKMGVRINIGSDSGASGIRHGEAFFEEKKILFNI